MWYWYVITAVIGYLIGCISFGYIGGKIFKGKDIRDVGSGNAGTANAIRNYGWGVGVFTFLGDVVKGLAATLIGLWLCGGIDAYFSGVPFGPGGLSQGTELGAYIGGVAAVVGHIWPVFLKFRGGKGVATTLGVLLILMPMWAGIVFGLCVIIIAFTKTMSIGSLLGTGLLVALSLIFYWGDIGHHVTCGMLAILVYYSHRANIKRLAEGKENQL